MAGKYDKAALVQVMEAFLLPTPNIIEFQMNADKVIHTWSVAAGYGSDEKKEDPTTHKKPDSWIVNNPLATKGYPKETFGFTFKMDANELAAVGNDPDLAKAAGLYPRLAALEMLQYPVSEGGSGIAAKSGRGRSLFRQTQGVFGRTFNLRLPFTGITAKNLPVAVPNMQLPTVLFVWGVGRVLPVRVSKLVITETEHDTNLNPTKADVDISLDVLTPDELRYVNGPLGSFAQGAYVWSQWQRQALAVSNNANTYQWISGMFS
jgi:hypothetical protein